MLLCALAAATLRGVVLPFPDVPDPTPDELPALPDSTAAAAPAAAPADDDAVAPWHAPTMAPDQFAANADAYKHPSAAVVKDWETAPKVEIFAPVEESPAAPAKEKKAEAALPVVKSSLQPIITNVKDDDPELAAIQQENPMAYGIVKALLLKKSLGMPLPGAEAVANHVADGAAHAPSSAAGISNMFSWHPADSASAGADDMLAAVEQTEQVSKTEPEPEQTIVIAPQREVETAAPQPAAAPEPESEVEAPKASLVSSSLSDFLGTSPKEAPAAPAATGMNSYGVPAAPAATVGSNSYTSAMTSYMNDLS